ncbi:aldehyde dehydrogenase family protein [Arthrobacter sp. CAN_A1]|uniref:aldehyde dehydrogenase family protein n=1 Tax=Arthrobacter sp. CAN_A1 TaxID=2787717 RepID=UPI0018CA7154
MTLSSGVGAATAVARLRRTFDAGTTRPLDWRRAQLKGLIRLFAEREVDLTDALHADLGKSRLEGLVSELSLVRAEAEYALQHLTAWATAERVPVPAGLLPAAAHRQAQPLGVVLIIGPWNYPVQLLLSPLVGALAAGNCAVLKPSELAPATSAVIADLLPLYCDDTAVTVMEGGPEVSTELLSQQYDSIFFTGGARVGRIVAHAAAEQLTPVTLELGGKSPAVVMDGNLRAVARRLIFGKFLNAGQTCVAPDYVLVTAGLETQLLQHLKEALAEFYGRDPHRSADYGRIINEQHFDRLVALLGSGTVYTGGAHDRAIRYLEPTLLTAVRPDSPVMQEEIFGPILPILAVSGMDEAVNFINSRPSPLAAYLFSNESTARQDFEARVRAGAIGHNACNLHLTVPGLPFGGVGDSGTGAYHGRYSFDTFSQLRGVLSKGTGIDTLRLAYPPHTGLKRWLLRRLL